MDGPTLFLQFLALLILGVSVFMKDEAHTYAMLALGFVILLSMAYNASVICHCVKSFFGRGCK